MKIFRYNQEGFLTDFVSTNYTGGTEVSIHLVNNVLVKKTKETPKKEVFFHEYAVLKENSQLITEFFVGEYWIRAIIKEQSNKDLPSKIKFPSKDFRISFSQKKLKSFTVTHDIITDWSNKLKEK